MNLPRQRDLDRVLGDMLGVVDAIEPLASGSGGSSVLVEAHGLRYVAKKFACGGRALLGPEAQYRLLEVLAEADIAPWPRGVDTNLQLLVVDYVADAAAEPMEAFSREDTLSRAAVLLRRLHAIDYELPRFAPVLYAERYLDAAGGLSALSSDDRRRYEELLALAARPPTGAACICHNDLIADHLLLGDSPKLIDFDYAVTAPPIVDLASLAVMNELDDSQSAALVGAYFAGPVPFDGSEFARVRRLLRLLAHFWALAGANTGAAPFDQYRIDDERDRRRAESQMNGVEHE